MPAWNNAPALVLASVITSAPIEPTPFHLRSSAPLYAYVPTRYEPLDLTAMVFRYLLPHRCDRRRKAKGGRRRAKG